MIWFVTSAVSQCFCVHFVVIVIMVILYLVVEVTSLHSGSACVPIGLLLIAHFYTPLLLCISNIL